MKEESIIVFTESPWGETSVWFEPHPEQCKNLLFHFITLSFFLFLPFSDTHTHIHILHPFLPFSHRSLNTFFRSSRMAGWSSWPDSCSLMSGFVELGWRGLAEVRLNEMKALWGNRTGCMTLWDLNDKELVWVSTTALRQTCIPRAELLCTWWEEDDEGSDSHRAHGAHLL